MGLSHRLTDERRMMMILLEERVMSERYELPKIKPAEAPSLFNHEAGKWGLLGALITAIPAGVAKVSSGPRLAAAVAAVGWVGGALYGAVNGKEQQEKEMTQGRVVKDPGYWNKGILSGLTATVLLGLPFSMAGKALPLTGAMGLAAMITGSIMRKNSLQKDFDQSLAIHEQQQAHIAQAMMMGKGKQQNYMNTVTPTESATLAQQFAAQNNHTQAVIQQAAAPEAAAAR
jgi:hypothetical protein